MGFSSGSVSFRRFWVVGQGAKQPDESLLGKLSDGALRVGDIGVPEPVEYGWSGGRHVLDSEFSFEHNVFNDCVAFALRIDTNKIPGDLKKAYTIMEEEAVAAGNPSGFISKQQKRDTRDAVRRKIDDELRSGRFRKSKLIPILWDVPAQIIYSPCPPGQFDKLAEIFSRTFGLDLQPVSSGSLAMRLLDPRGRRRDYEDARATRFVTGPEGEGQLPDYPWVAKGPEPKDFLGNEFLTWLWHEAEKADGVIAAEAGGATVFFDKSLDLDCAYGSTGRDSLRADGATKMPEARAALRVGKVPRKAAVLYHSNGQDFSFSLGAESLSLMTLKLPEIEDADSPRVLFEERITLIRDLCKSLDTLFDAFLKVRTGSGWEAQTNAIRRWIMQSSKAQAAA